MFLIQNPFSLNAQQFYNPFLQIISMLSSPFSVILSHFSFLKQLVRFSIMQKIIQIIQFQISSVSNFPSSKCITFFWLGCRDKKSLRHVCATRAEYHGAVLRSLGYCPCFEYVHVLIILLVIHTKWQYESRDKNGAFLFFTEPFTILPTKFSRRKSCFEITSQFYGRSQDIFSNFYSSLLKLLFSGTISQRKVFFSASESVETKASTCFLRGS